MKDGEICFCAFSGQFWLFLGTFWPLFAIFEHFSAIFDVFPNIHRKEHKDHKEGILTNRGGPIQT
ncbi:MAG: hypothetical protein AB7T27_07280 [Kiritimatiellia bacterium]